MEIHGMIEMVREVVITPGVDPQVGTWQPDGRCCVGARLAYALGLKSGSYLEGIDEWARQMGGNRAQVLLMLKSAGAGNDPTGGDEWPAPPQVVWDNLSQVERLPQLAGQDLSAMNLSGADLTDADLRGADLTSANLTGANLAGANLTGANLTGANLRDADLRDVMLTGANLTGADLRRTDLTGADLTGADLTHANRD